MNRPVRETPATPAPNQARGGSIVSYPSRGPWGDANWRGNCSGYLYRDLFELLRPKLFVDPMCGSGTSMEVAREMGIRAVGLDLHSGFDICRESIRARLGEEADLCLSHPPYAGMIVYSGQVWGNAPHPADLSRCTSNEKFVDLLEVALLNQRDATRPNGHFGVIIGDQRQEGSYFSYQAELIARMPREELASVIIKAQHNVHSAAQAYQLRYPRILHEYVLLWRKSGRLISFLSLLGAKAREQRARLVSTWCAVVHAALLELGGEATLERLYAVIERHAPERLARNPHWQAKVRQTLQIYPRFVARERGRWAIA